MDYIDKDKMIKGEIYKIHIEGFNDWIIKFSHFNVNDIHHVGCIYPSQNSFNNSGHFGTFETKVLGVLYLKN